MLSKPFQKLGFEMVGEDRGFAVIFKIKKIILICAQILKNIIYSNRNDTNTFSRKNITPIGIKRNREKWAITA